MEFNIIAHVITSASTAIVAVGSVVVFFVNRDNKRHNQAVSNAAKIKHTLHQSDNSIVRRLTNIENLLKELVKK